jgi:hypothetical protein
MIETLKEEQNKAKISHEKQCSILTEQALNEKNEIKAVCIIIKSIMSEMREKNKFSLRDNSAL